jgi:hypothetical protein
MALELAAEVLRESWDLVITPFLNTRAEND